MIDTSIDLGPLRLRSPLIAAAGTVGWVTDFVEVGALQLYGAAVSKSVSEDPWSGKPAPRLAPAGTGMLNGIGIQNPGVAAWAEDYGSRLAELEVPVWGSAVGKTVDEFARVAKALSATAVTAIEVNLSCPNLDGHMFALDADAASQVIDAVRSSVGLPIGAKLSPNAADIVAVAGAVAEAGADFVTLPNTIWGMGIDVDSGKPLLSGGVGGYSGPPLKPIALRCVWEVAAAYPHLPIVGCGGIRSGRDVAEYLLAGASAVQLGTVHFAEPRAGARILRELQTVCRSRGDHRVADLARAGRR